MVNIKLCGNDKHKDIYFLHVLHPILLKLLLRLKGDTMNTGWYPGSKECYIEYRTVYGHDDISKLCP